MRRSPTTGQFRPPLPLGEQDLGASPRDRLLAAATRLFCRYGINATGIDLVVSEAGTAKTTLYKVFGSKEGLVEAVLETEGRAWREWFFLALADENAQPRARLKAIFPALKRWFGKAEFFGCPFINAIGEHDKAEDRLRGITLHHKKIVLKHIETLAAEAGADDPVALAHQLGILMDGAIVAAMVTRDDTIADAAGHAADALIDGAVATRPHAARASRGVIRAGRLARSPC